MVLQQHYRLAAPYKYQTDKIGWVGEDCYSKVKKTIEHAFYRLPIALIVMMLMCYVIHAAVTLEMLRATISGG